jgi:hypothetical protein
MSFQGPYADFNQSLIFQKCTIFFAYLFCFWPFCTRLWCQRHIFRILSSFLSTPISYRRSSSSSTAFVVSLHIWVYDLIYVSSFNLFSGLCHIMEHTRTHFLEIKAPCCLVSRQSHTPQGCQVHFFGSSRLLKCIHFIGLHIQDYRSNTRTRATFTYQHSSLKFVQILFYACGSPVFASRPSFSFASVRCRRIN